MSDKELEVIMSDTAYQYPGLEGSVQTLAWIWNTHFAAVAADSPGFEAWSKYRLCTVLAVQDTRYHLYPVHKRG